MGKWLNFFRRPVLVELKQIICSEGDTIFLATSHVLSARAREEVKKQLDGMACERGVKFAVFDGARFFVVNGTGQ